MKEGNIFKAGGIYIHTEIKKPTWAYIYLIISGFYFLTNGLQFILGFVAVMVAFFRGESTIVSVSLYLIGLVLAYVWFRFFLKAIKDIKEYKKAISNIGNTGQSALNQVQEMMPKKRNWVLIGILVLIACFLGPGIIFIPILPLFLAGMSTDSGDVPTYVPFLIIVVGYTIIGGFGYLIYKAFKAKRA